MGMGGVIPIVPPFAIIISAVPPVIHPQSSCSGGWRQVVCCWHCWCCWCHCCCCCCHCSTYQPPHKQLLVRLGVGGCHHDMAWVWASVVMWRHGRGCPCLITSTLQPRKQKKT
ncbi:hypothetical protein L208DRAFT_832028 [Tricholoma matsutake]|nr:hypothetical protein L208DRAFT_832028 [Tricholoma matsutake 945]